MLKRIVLLGPPGAGKGTQAEQIAKALGVPHLSTGNILRAAITNRTSIGLAAKEYMDKGQLVPSAVVFESIRETLETVPGYILDGFPRTLLQAEVLTGLAASRNEPVQAALLISVPDEVIIDRLASRRSCPKCNTIYNLKSKPPIKDETCDACASPLLLRNDDRPEVIAYRLEQYAKEISSVIDYYKGEKILHRIAGDLPPEQVTEKILKVLE